jgi:hypothetical protein
VHTKEPHHPSFNHNNCNLQVSIFQKEQKIETKQGHPPNKLVPPQTQIHLIHSTNKKHHNTKEQVAKNKQYSEPTRKHHRNASLIINRNETTKQRPTKTKSLIPK